MVLLYLSFLQCSGYIFCFPGQKVDSSKSFPGKEEMELSLQKFDSDLKVARHERDKALQELKRLKQHLLEKVHVL